MEGMQPRIDHAQGDHERDRIGADDVRPRPVAEHLAVDRPVDRELDSVDQRENRSEGEIGDNHRAQRAADCDGVDPCRKGEDERYDK